MEGYLSLIDGAVEAQRTKWLGNTALDQGFAQKLLHSNERHFVITKVWVDQRCSWMLVKQNDPTTLRHASEFNHDLLDWFDKVWWGLCSVSGADLAWFGQGMGGLLLWSCSPCGEREEQKATRPPLLQEQLQWAADIFWLCNGRQSLCLPIRWGLGIRAGVGEGTNGGRKLGFACNYCTLWPTSSFLSLAAEIHSSSWRLVCEWDWMHHFSCMARGRLSLLLDKKKINKSISSSHALLFLPYQGFILNMFLQWQANWVKLGSLMQVITWQYCRFLQATWDVVVSRVVAQMITHYLRWLPRPKWAWSSLSDCIGVL